MTPKERTKNIVDGFFIGGEGDDLQQPNLKKADLRLSVLNEVRAAEIETLRWAKELFEDSLHLATAERRWAYFRTRMDSEIKRRETL